MGCSRGGFKTDQETHPGVFVRTHCNVINYRRPRAERKRGEREKRIEVMRILRVAVIDQRVPR